MEIMEKTKKQILLFGGTMEGRTAAERLLAENVPCTVCVATEYGIEVMEPHPLLTLHAGRLDHLDMADMIRKGAFACVIDATHPHAQKVTEEIRSACRETGMPYLRVQRDFSETVAPGPALPQPGEGLSEDMPSVLFMQNAEEAAAFLERTQGTVLVTTGSKELEKIAEIIGDPSRIAARVLPSPDSLAACARAGLRGKQIMAMQGPFDRQMNIAMIRHTGASWLLTKETGAAGGYPQKLEAARACGIRTVVIRAPQKRSDEKKQQTGPAVPCPDEKVRSAVSAGAMSLEQVLRAALTYLAGEENGTSRSGAGVGRNDNGTCRSGAGVGRDDNGTSRSSAGVGRNDNGTSRSSAGVGRDDNGTCRSGAGVGRDDNGTSRSGAGTGIQDLWLVGVGTGSRQARTFEAQEALDRAEVIFGAESVLRLLREDRLPADSVMEPVYLPVYDSALILQYLREHPQISRAAVAYSGDSGFYSGAASMLSLLGKPPAGQGMIRSDKEPDPERLPGKPSEGGAVIRSDEGSDPERLPGKPSEGGAVIRSDEGPDPEKHCRNDGTVPSGTAGHLRVRLICGISSISWFAARAGIPWQDWKILSSHGRTCNVVGQVRRNTRCFLLLSGAEDLRRTGRLLADAQRQGILGELRLIYGYELSRPAEEIRELTPQELCGCTPEKVCESTLREPVKGTPEEDLKGSPHEPGGSGGGQVELKEGLYVLYIEHRGAKDTPVLPGMADSAFLRGKAPMTSAEVRALSLCRLGLTAQAVVWDVGAGTGSVSIEAASTCPEGTVWSVEYKKDALELLLKNRAKYCLSNMEIIEGRAPEILRELPAPTHVFIGGSGGEIGAVIETALEKNPGARFVANCITAETLAALQAALKRLPVRNIQAVQVSVQRMEEIGRYHYLKAQNPVFIISFAGSSSGPEHCL